MFQGRLNTQNRRGEKQSAKIFEFRFGLWAVRSQTFRSIKNPRKIPQIDGFNETSNTLEKSINQNKPAIIAARIARDSLPVSLMTPTVGDLRQGLSFARIVRDIAERCSVHCAGKGEADGVISQPPSFRSLPDGGELSRAGRAVAAHWPASRAS